MSNITVSTMESMREKRRRLVTKLRRMNRNMPAYKLWIYRNLCCCGTS